MKYWEIVKSLTENPALIGNAVIGSKEYELYVHDSGTLQSSTYYTEIGTKGTSIGKAGNIDFDGWEIVRQPVTWQEAIQAWAEDGKTIKCEHGQMTFVYDQEGELFRWSGGAHKSLFTNGIWYVED